MNRKFEELLFCVCTCTLKGIKPGSMFSAQKKIFPNIYEDITYYKDILENFGLKLELIKDDKNYLLLYLYRPKHLKIIWKQKKYKEFLYNRGYSNDINTNISILIEKLKQSEFPHDIGVFLGYNLDDVISYIDNNGENYKALGHWKVYNNEADKQIIFSMFNKYTKFYLDKFYSGYSLQQLI